MAKLQGGTTVYGLLSTTGVVYTSSGNSDQWNSVYTTAGTLSSSISTKLPLSGGTLTNGLTGTTAIFTTSVSSIALSGTHYGDGSKLTGVIAAGGVATDSTKLALTGGTINGNLLINGGLTALSGATFINTIFQDTSALRIYNSGIGPALYVEQAAGSGDIAKFYDADGIEVLHVGNALNPESAGVIGIKTSTPNKTLTINGEVSAASGVWASTYYGDGSNLSNVRDSTKLPLSGGTLTGKLDGNDANFSNSLYATTITAVDFIGNGSQLTGIAKLDSPTFTGTPAAPTAPAGTNTTQIATTQFVIQNRGDRYLTTSSTSLALLNNRTYSLTAGTNLSYTSSQPITLVYDTTHFMDANVVSYNTDTGAMVIDGTSRTGTGTFSAWTINVQSTPVAGGLIASNNLSDVASPSAALINLGGFPSYGGTLNGGLTGTRTQFNSVTFTPNATAAPYELGKVWYDSNKDALAYYNSVSSNILHIGQEIQQYVRNATANTILKGDVVRIIGFTNQSPDVVLAQANTLSGSIITGVANQDILANSNGYIVTIGEVANFNTSRFSSGEDLFLSPLSAGKITNVLPTNPYFAVQVGVCMYSHATNGKMLIYTQYLGTAANTVVGILGMEQLPTSVGSTVSTVSGLSSRWESVYTNVNANSSTYATLTGTQTLKNKTVVDWMTLVRGYNTTPTLYATIATGDVYTYVYNSSPSNITYYRFIATDGSTDAFYTSFNGTSLSGIVASKSITI